MGGSQQKKIAAFDNSEPRALRTKMYCTLPFQIRGVGQLEGNFKRAKKMPLQQM